MKKAAEQFNIDYRTILKHLDTNKVILKDNKLVLLYSKKLTLDHLKKEKKNINKWDYKNMSI